MSQYFLIVCAPRMSRSDGCAHVFPQENLRRSRLSSDRRKPPRRRASASAGDRYAGAHRGFARQGAIGAIAAVGRALRREGHRRQRPRRGNGGGERGAAHRPCPGVRTLVGRDWLPQGDRRPLWLPQIWFSARTRGVSHRSASPVRGRLRSRGGPLARGLYDRWRRGHRSAPPLSGDGLARRGARGRSTGSRPLGFREPPSLYFEGEGGQTLGQRGFSKDHRPDLNQMILAVLLDGDGRPVCTEMWPGNTADVNSLIPAIDRLQRRFRINRVCVVADRGMISAETIAELEARRLLYVLGA